MKMVIFTVSKNSSLTRKNHVRELTDLGFNARVLSGLGHRFPQMVEIYHTNMEHSNIF